MASPEERAEARKTFLRNGGKVPDASMAYFIDEVHLQPMFEELLSSLIVDMYDISYLIRETKQTKLTFEQKI